MLKTGKKEQAVEDTTTKKEVETQLGVTLFNKPPEPTISLVVTEEEDKHQEDTVNPMEPMEERHKDKDSTGQAKEGQTSIPIVK